ncbi:MAG: Ig-like domain-containing protein [Burkholderiales bacterium]|nr:Ig-like domain-containing protein [Burkholderiales bacterium]
MVPPVVVPPVVTLQSVAVVPSTVTLVVGGKQSFVASGVYSDGSSKPITSGLTWTAGGTVASVDAATGELTAKAVGTDTVTAAVGALTGSAKVVVTAPYMAVAGGGAHTVAIKTDGSLYGWGWNRDGQLGDGTLVSKSSPTVAGTSKLYATVGAGEFHSVALRSDGTLWAWGFNRNGQLGTGNNASQAAPTAVGKDTDWTSVAVGANHTMAIKKDGTLWAWGQNFFGQLGMGNTSDLNVPTVVPTLSMPELVDGKTVAVDVVWSAVSAGAEHTLARDSKGRIWAWGRNFNGQLGLGTTTDVSVPTQIGTATNWASVAAGGKHSLAIRSDGALFAWGSNFYGQLATTNGSATEVDSNVPVKVGTDGDWAAVAAGAAHSLGIRTNGTLWVWGANGDGQLGDGTLTPKASVTQIGSGRNWLKLSAGPYTSFAIQTNGLLYGWGRNVDGQQGNGAYTPVLAPSVIP